MDEAEIAVNERIDKLFEQALEEFMAENKYATIIVPDPLKEKFAQLIVRECVQVCEPILDEPYENMTEFGKGLVEGQDVAIERIKEHFGVEL
jgi:hypothetical protein